MPLRRGDIPADHQFLVEADLHLHPRAAALAWFIPAVQALRDDALQIVLARGAHQRVGAGVQGCGEPYRFPGVRERETQQLPASPERLIDNLLSTKHEKVESIEQECIAIEAPVLQPV